MPVPNSSPKTGNQSPPNSVISSSDSLLFYQFDIPLENLIVIQNEDDLKILKKFTDYAYLFDKSEGSSRTQPVLVGIDTETPPFTGKRITSVLQMAIRNSSGTEKVFIVDLLSLSKPAHASCQGCTSDQNNDFVCSPYEAVAAKANDETVNNHLMRELDSILTTLFTNSAIIKVGQGLCQDFMQLHKSFSKLTSFRSCVSILETNKLHQLLNPCIHNEISLKNLTRNYLHFDLDKSCQLSNWKQRPMTQKQILYAACDALVLLRLYDVMIFEIQYSHSLLHTPSASSSPTYEFCNKPMNVETATTSTRGGSSSIGDSDRVSFVCEDIYMHASSNCSDSGDMSCEHYTAIHSTNNENINKEKLGSNGHFNPSSSPSFSIYDHLVTYTSGNTSSSSSSSSSNKKKRKLSGSHFSSSDAVAASSGGLTHPDDSARRVASGNKAPRLHMPHAQSESIVGGSLHNTSELTTSSRSHRQVESVDSTISPVLTNCENSNNWEGIRIDLLEINKCNSSSARSSSSCIGQIKRRRGSSLDYNSSEDELEQQQPSVPPYRRFYSFAERYWFESRQSPQSIKSRSHSASSKRESTLPTSMGKKMKFE